MNYKAEIGQCLEDGRRRGDKLWFLELLREIALYEYLDKEPALRDSSEALDNFYDERSDENIGLLREMEKAIANNDWVLAAYLRDQVIDENLVTSAFKTVLNTLFSLFLSLFYLL